MIITSRERDLGGFTVRRLLPYATHRMVGPFIFFDHIGPAQFAPGQGLAVRPHPHINLATVTYLFEGKIQHRDSLGSNQLIEPGAINWMTAGHGIVHSERTPHDLLQKGCRLSGIQCWVALPDEHEETTPNFTHYPANVLPEFSIEQVELKLLLGHLFDRESPVKVHSDLFYVTAKLPAGSELTIPVNQREAAIYIVTGKVDYDQQSVEHCSLIVNDDLNDMTIKAIEDTQIMILGGKPVGQRYIYWNFVASSEEKIAKAKEDWLNGPGPAGSRFPKIPGDDQEYIPLPEEQNPKGTVM